MNYPTNQTLTLERYEELSRYHIVLDHIAKHGCYLVGHPVIRDAVRLTESTDVEHAPVFSPRTSDCPPKRRCQNP